MKLKPKREKPVLPTLGEEVLKIGFDVVRGIFSIFLPIETPGLTKKQREWCQCPRRGQWHFKAGK